MGSITKTAMKAIKFYKHVVQNVEKFILKCKPEYKIPGLYVIDSIVRQSRHQFGPEKDVFAPRFARNMEETFAHLFRCSQEDKVRSEKWLFKRPSWWLISVSEQNHSCLKPVAEEQRLCPGSDSTALRFSKSRSPGAPSVYATTAATESARRFKRAQRSSWITTSESEGRAGRWWNGKKYNCNNSVKLTKFSFLAQRVEHSEISVSTTNDAAAAIIDGSDVQHGFNKVQ